VFPRLLIATRAGASAHVKASRLVGWRGRQFDLSANARLVSGGFRGEAAPAPAPLAGITADAMRSAAAAEVRPRDGAPRVLARLLRLRLAAPESRLLSRGGCRGRGHSLVERDHGASITAGQVGEGEGAEVVAHRAAPEVHVLSASWSREFVAEVLRCHFLPALPAQGGVTRLPHVTANRLGEDGSIEWSVATAGDKAEWVRKWRPHPGAAGASQYFLTRTDVT
jgi:hypothetical protein